MMATMDSEKLKIENETDSQLSTFNSQLKKGWEIKKLGEVCNFQNGFAFKSKTYKDEGTPVVRITNIQDEKLDLTKIVYVNPIDYNKDLSKYKIVKGDLLIAMSGATTGKIGIHRTDEELLLNQRVGKFEPKQTLDKTYLLNFLKTKVEESLAISAGAAQPNLSTEQIKGFKIPLPPLPEQQRIVAILDKAFTAIATAKENAQQNLLNAKELFESYLQNVFENKGDDWEEKRFDEVCVLQRGFDFPKRLRKEGSYPLVSSSGISDYVDVWKVKSPGVSTGRSGTIGKIHFIEQDYFPLNTSLYIKEFHGNDERCIYYFLKQFDLSRFQSGAGVPTLNRNNVHSVKIYFPKSIKEQQQIVKKLNSLSDETKKLEAIYQQKINDLEELKKSVLNKAFKGEL
jgi:type I restriction enzyme S subunit